jgi:plasmid stabilization system protein ParE
MTTTASDEVSYESFLARLGVRDRQAIERHVAACETEGTPEHATLWRRLACLLASLASTPAAGAEPKDGRTSRQFGVQTSGQKAVQFFAPDGKYRRQIFALEDLRDGVLVVYTIDALDAALRAGALRGPIRKEDGVAVYEICGCEGNATVTIEPITAANVGSAPDYYRHMVGWNRTALKVSMKIPGDDARLRALNVLYSLAAKQATGAAAPQ